MGTWFGIAEKGKIAFLANYRDHRLFSKDKILRGRLVGGFFEGTLLPQDFIKQITVEDYNPFNFVFGSIDKLYYFNLTDKLLQLSKGIYALSNNLLNTSWPKVVKAKSKI